MASHYTRIDGSHHQEKWKWLKDRWSGLMMGESNDSDLVNLRFYLNLDLSRFDWV